MSKKPGFCTCADLSPLVSADSSSSSFLKSTRFMRNKLSSAHPRLHHLTTRLLQQHSELTPSANDTMHPPTTSNQQPATPHHSSPSKPAVTFPTSSPTPYLPHPSTYASDTLPPHSQLTDFPVSRRLGCFHSASAVSVIVCHDV